MRLKYSAVILLVCIIFSACSINHEGTTTGGVQDSVPLNEKLQIQTALDFYSETLFLLQTEFETTLREKCHYEVEESFEKTLQSGWKVKSFEILRIEQLSDELWVIETHYYYERIELYDVDYVAMIDGEWKLMFTENHIPAAIKEGVEIPEYDHENPDLV